MKSKRRHELQTNELADRLGHWIERLRPHLTLITLVVVGAVAILVAWYFVAYRNESSRAQAWRSYMDAGSDPQANPVSELSAVADRYSDTLAGLWAAQTAADLESAQGVRLLFQDRAKAETSLSAAEATYRDVLNNKHLAKSPMLERRAHFGLARTLEALGKLEEAKDQYQKVVDAEKDSALADAARDHLARLDTSATRSWYNWFSRQKPVPRKMEGGGLGGLESALPGTDLGTLPETPGDDFMKDVPADGADDAAGPEPGKDASATVPAGDATTPPPSETPAPSADTPSADAPNTDAPSGDTPSADAPPSEAPPADASKAEPPAAGDGPKTDEAGQ